MSIPKTLNNLVFVLAIWLGLLTVVHPTVALSASEHTGHSEHFGIHSIEPETGLTKYIVENVSHCKDTAGQCDFYSFQTKISPHHQICPEMRTVFLSDIGIYKEYDYRIFKPPKKLSLSA